MEKQEKYTESKNARTKEQKKVMDEIRKAGHCPFCRENLRVYHKEPITWEGKYWILTDNQWPYPGKNVHKLIILKEHAESIIEIPAGAGDELIQIVRMILEETGIAGGAIGLRFGDPSLSGATVRHIHAQVISPQEGTEPVKFFIGSRADS